MTRLQKNVVANYLGQGWTAAMALVFIPAYLRYMGVEAYGLVGLFAVVQTWAMLLDLGLTPTLSREMARYSAGAHSSRSIRDLMRTLELLYFALAALVAACLWAASGYLAREWLNVEALAVSAVAEALAIMAATVALRFVEGLYRASLIGLQRQVTYNVLSAVLATLQHGGAVVILAFVSPTVRAFFVWYGATSLLALVVFRAALSRALPRQRIRPRFNRETLAGTWQFAGSMAGLTVLSVVVSQLDKVWLSRVVTLEQFAHYTLATAIAGILYRVLMPLGHAVYPRFVELSTQEQHEVLAGLYHVSAQTVTVITAPLAIVLALFSGGALFAWSGDPSLTAHVAPVLTALAIGNLLHGLGMIPYHVQIANGWVGLAVAVNAVAVVLLVPALLLIVPVYGVAGAAWLWAAVGAGHLICSVHFMHRRLLIGERLRWLVHDVLVPCTGAASVAVALKALQPAGYSSRINWFLFLTAALGLSWPASFLLSSHLRPRLTAWWSGSRLAADSARGLPWG